MEKYKRKIKEDYDYEYEKNNERFTIYIPISYVIVSLLLVGLSHLSFFPKDLPEYRY